MKENMHEKYHPIQQQEKYNALETRQDHYIFHNLKKHKDF